MLQTVVSVPLSVLELLNRCSTSVNVTQYHTTLGSSPSNVNNTTVLTHIESPKVINPFPYNRRKSLLYYLTEWRNFMLIPIAMTYSILLRWIWTLIVSTNILLIYSSPEGSSNLIILPAKHPLREEMIYHVRDRVLWQNAFKFSLLHRCMQPAFFHFNATVSMLLTNTLLMS